MTTTAIRLSGRKTSTATAVLQRALAWHRRRASRRQLETLTLEQLRDLGLDPDVISRGHAVPGNP